MSHLGPPSCSNCGQQHPNTSCPVAASPIMASWVKDENMTISIVPGTLGGWGVTEGPVCTCPPTWLGIYPPEPCDTCKNRMTATQTSHTLANYPWPAVVNNSTNVEAAMQELAKAVGARIGANGLGDEGSPAHDAWMEALGVLRALKTAVQRAVEAEASK